MENAIVTVGGSARFHCVGENLGWDMYVSGEENPLSISINQNIVNTTKYTLSSDDYGRHSGRYILWISVTTLQDAGRYRCKYVPLPTLFTEAELVVLGEKKIHIVYEKNR